MARPQTSAALSLTAFAAPPVLCSACGSEEIAIDEVYERGLWTLAECRRCKHQWTDGPSGGPRAPLARVRSVRREVHVVAA